uniref:Putative secreted protein n=1 Tax=Xenopsylla cheopis TaxID=163159 RepID=A0A6M2E2G2_XENCH
MTAILVVYFFGISSVSRSIKAVTVILAQSSANSPSFLSISTFFWRILLTSRALRASRQLWPTSDMQLQLKHLEI